MRKLILLATLASSLAGLLLFGATVPRKAPEFVFPLPDGTQKLLSQYRGKTVVIAFMFTTCPHCQHTAQVLTKIQTEYAAKDVQIVGACFDKDAPVATADFSKKLALNFPVGVTNQASVQKFVQIPENEPYFVPILLFVDRTGTIRSQYVGDEKFLANQEVSIRAEIDKTLKLGAKPAAPKS